MKKLLLLIILSLSINLFAQDSSKTPILDKTEHLVDKYSSKIAETFSTTMEKATPIAKEGFKMAVTVQVAKGIALLLPLVAFLIFSFLFVKEYKNIQKLLSLDSVPLHMNKHYGPFNEDNINPLLVFSLILSVITGILSIICTYSGVLYLIAPKWFAIKEIIELLK